MSSWHLQHYKRFGIKYVINASSPLKTMVLAWIATRSHQYSHKVYEMLPSQFSTLFTFLVFHAGFRVTHILVSTFKGVDNFWPLNVVFHLQPTKHRCCSKLLPPQVSANLLYLMFLTLANVSCLCKYAGRTPLNWQLQRCWRNTDTKWLQRCYIIGW